MSPALKSQILLIDNEQDTKRLSLQLVQEGYEVVEAKTGEEGLAQALRRCPDLIVLEVLLQGMDGYTLVRRLRQNSTTAHVPILLLTHNTEAAERIAGFEAGADDYVSKPYHPKELGYRIKRLLAGRATQGPAPKETRPRGRVIALFSPKGGVGKTTLSVNLAIALRGVSNKPVAIFDADFFFGNVGVQLNLPLSYTVLDFIKHLDEIDAQLAEQVLVHHASGVSALLSPHQPEHSEAIKPEHVMRILSLLRELYPYVVVDCQPSYDERILTILDQADEILLVLTPEIGPFRNASLFLGMAGSIGVPANRIRILLNRYNSQVGIEADQIEQTLQRRVKYHVVSGGRAVVSSTNRGTPLIMEKPKHEFSRQVMEIAADIHKRLYVPVPETPHASTVKEKPLPQTLGPLQITPATH